MELKKCFYYDIVEISRLEGELLKMYEVCMQMLKISHSPYSRIRVGAAVLTENSKLTGGTNIENSALGETICAERNALFQAITEYPHEKIKAIMILTDGINGVFAPCGACRQVMIEISRKQNSTFTVFFPMDKKRLIKIHDVSHLLPFEFYLRNS